VTLRAVTLLLASVLASSCSEKKDEARAQASPLAAAETLIDAFYLFDPRRLRSAMSAAPGSQPEILYYQGWAQGGNYRVLDRQPCRVATPDEIACSITVKDDLITALGTGYDVTDTFHLSVDDGRIVSVRTSSNDPPEFEQALKWLRRERPELMTGPCRGFFAGGPTPRDCVRAVVKGFAEFSARNR
jgi:hypothetical protein